MSVDLLTTGYPFFGVLAVSLYVVISGIWKWIMWLVLALCILLFQTGFSVYQGTRIFLDLVVLAVLKIYLRCMKFSGQLFGYDDVTLTRQKMHRAASYEEWLHYAEQLDELTHRTSWRQESDSPVLQKLIQTTYHLSSMRSSQQFDALLYELPGIVKRNHLGVDAYELHAHCASGTKHCIEAFQAEVINCLQYLHSLPDHALPLHHKVEFFKKLSKNLGQSALCLSGGGSLSMYHMGVIRTLISTGQYKNIRVISGTSGGSICAAMCAAMTEDELSRLVCVKEVSTDFGFTGAMQAKGIVWFPSLWQQGLHFLRHGCLIERDEFSRTTQFYYGDMTFLEAYQKTHKHVCIPVTASNVGTNLGPQKLLLNHLSTPHVLLSSAVAASCALPGIMKSVQLLCKTSSGSIIPFEVDGVHWIDGSVQADVPFKRMSNLFSVSNFIVSQVNFHVLPFIHHKIPGAIPTDSVWIRSILSAIDLDLRHRSLILSKMGLLPTLYGNDISKMFSQKYHGDVTIVPDMKIDESLGVKAIMNPTVKDMEAYLSGGQKATWPHVKRIKHLLEIESSIWNILERLVKKQASRSHHSNRERSVSDLIVYSQINTPVESDHHHDQADEKDIEIERLKTTVTRLEQENSKLKRLLKNLQ